MHKVAEKKDSLLQVIQLCMDKKTNFAAYRLPDKGSITLVIQKDDAVRELDQVGDDFPTAGYLIAPFCRESGNRTYLIRPDLLIRGEAGPEHLSALESIPAYNPPEDKDYPAETSKKDYVRQIEETLLRIRAGEFEKIVLSRVKSVDGNYTSKLARIFDGLCRAYSNAFVYVFCVKGQCWIGASPEPFICSRGEELYTVSLAGTRPFKDANMEIGNWNRKELMEQDYVTRHIEKILVEFEVNSYTRNGPYTARAGNLSHLRTDFAFPIWSAGNQLPSLINALHPTPAVCGMASGKAMDFINESEKHNREYYSGFLGPVGLDDLLQLYVNLRCLKVYDDRLILFIGGGITQDSDPAEEWEETEIKSDTLLSVLRQIK
jgi:isochorismate synthase